MTQYLLHHQHHFSPLSLYQPLQCTINYYEQNTKMSPERNNLSQYLIPSIPASIYYIPNFITATEEQTILTSLPQNRWINLTHRRLQAHPSTLSKTNVLLESPLPSWLTDPILSRFDSLGLFKESLHGKPNHVLVNEYNAGEGIMPHEDGGTYFPIVATVSLGAGIVLDVQAKRSSSPSLFSSSLFSSSSSNLHAEPTTWRIFQEPRSLLITTGTAYTDLLHGIAEVKVDEGLTPQTVANWTLLGDSEALVRAGGRNERGTRTSLTYRDVLKVSKVGSKIFGRPRT